MGLYLQVELSNKTDGTQSINVVTPKGSPADWRGFNLFITLRLFFCAFSTHDRLPHVIIFMLSYTASQAHLVCVERRPPFAPPASQYFPMPAHVAHDPYVLPMPLPPPSCVHCLYNRMLVILEDGHIANEKLPNVNVGCMRVRSFIIAHQARKDFVAIAQRCLNIHYGALRV
jgi:hypothetical protein